MKAPQIILLVLMLGSPLLHAIKHGEPMDRKYDFPMSLLNLAIITLLLVWGGFFR